MRIEGDLRATCIRERIDALVSRKLSSFDLVPVIVPQSVDFENVEQVTAAVGGGPHSPFAVAVAARLGITMGVPTMAASVYREPDDRESTLPRLESLVAPFPSVRPAPYAETAPSTSLRASTPQRSSSSAHPGGSWFQRQIYGPGHRLAVRAPAGVLGRAHRRTALLPRGRGRRRSHRRAAYVRVGSTARSCVIR